jgi:putative salt-induced outer membrane protein YdiY
MSPRPIPDSRRHLLRGLAVACLFFCFHAGAVNVVVQLKNGDRITGELITQETNHVVISTPWAKSLTLPISAIGGLRTTEGVALYTPPAATNAPAPALVAAAKPKPSPPPPPPKKKHLTTTANFGLDLLSGNKDRQIYYSRIKSTYARPFEHNPKEFFRTTGEYLANYGQTDGAKSANNMLGTVQTDVDVNPYTYFYNAGNVGYDEIRKIELQYGVGPGVGRHIFRKPTFAFDLESGVNYQVQERTEGDSPESAYFRLADNLTWKLADRLTFGKKLEFQLSFQDASQFRVRLDSNLSYRLWNTLSINLTLIDSYDTNPAPGVAENELQLRSSLGFTF